MSRARSFSTALCLAASLAATAFAAGCDPAEEDDLTISEAPPHDGKGGPQPVPLAPAPGAFSDGKDEQLLPPGIETRLSASARCLKGRVVVTASQRVDLGGGDAPVLLADSGVATLRVGDQTEVIELVGAGHLTVAGGSPGYLLYLFTNGALADQATAVACESLFEATIQVDLLMKDGETVCRIEGPASQPRHVECSK